MPCNNVWAMMKSAGGAFSPFTQISCAVGFLLCYFDESWVISQCPIWNRWKGCYGHPTNIYNICFIRSSMVCFIYECGKFYVACMHAPNIYFVLKIIYSSMLQRPFKWNFMFYRFIHSDEVMSCISFYLPNSMDNRIGSSGMQCKRKIFSRQYRPKWLLT